MNNSTSQVKYLALSCGFDIDSKSLHACFMAQRSDRSVKVIRSKRFDNRVSGFKSLLEWLAESKHRCGVDLPLQLVMESTGVYHEGVLEVLYEAGYEVSVQAAGRVKQYLRSIGQISKTDKLDARGIAQMGIERSLRAYKPYSKSCLAIRSLLRYRRTLVTRKTQLLNQQHAYGWSNYVPKKVLSLLKQDIKRIKQQIKQVEQEVQRHYKKDTKLYQHLQPIVDSLPGLGVLSALVIVCEANGFEHFTNRKQVLSFAGYDLVQHQSGNSAKRSRISKHGSAHIRHMLYMVVISAQQSATPIGAFYKRLEDAGKPYKVCSVAVQRKILGLIYTLFQSGQGYCPIKHQQGPISPNNNPTSTKKVVALQEAPLHEITG